MPPSAQTDNPDQAFELLGGLLGSGQHPDAGTLAAQLSGLPALSAAQCGMIAEALTTAGRNEEATAFLTRAASENIDHPGLHHALGSCLQAEGRFEEALKHYRHAISLCPHSEPSLCQAGSVLRKLGRTEEALECLGAAVRFNPDSAVALYNLGNALVFSNNCPAAITAYKRALALNPDWEELLNNLSATLAASKQYGEAMPLLLQLLRTRPEHAQYKTRASQCILEIEARKNAGVPINEPLAEPPSEAAVEANSAKPLTAAHQTETTFLSVADCLSEASRAEDPTELIRALAERLQSESDPRAAIVDAVLDAGLENDTEAGWIKRLIAADVLHKLGHAEDARQQLRSAETLCAHTSADLLKIAAGYKRLEHREDALRLLRKASEHGEGCAQALEMLASLQLEHGEAIEAERSIRRAIALRPSRWELHLQLGFLLYSRGLFNEALRLAEPATKISQDPALQINLSTYYLKCHRFMDALRTIESCLQRNPRLAAGYMNLGIILSRLGLAEQSSLAFKKACDLSPESDLIASNHIHGLNYLPGISSTEVFNEQQSFARKFESPLLAERKTHSNTREPHRRLRIGYVSGDFRDHSVAYFLEPILRFHDAAQFEVWAVASAQWNDRVTERIRRACQGWINASNLSDSELAQELRNHEFDILVDLSCHTEGTRLMTFARKPAPIQITMIGMQQSTGLSSIDYRISDAIMDPPGLTEHLHSEELLRLECAFAFAAPLDAPAVAMLPAGAGTGVTFGSFNNVAKIHPAVAQTWAQILGQVPGSKLIAVAPEGNALETMLLQAGIDPASFTILPLQHGEQYWNLLNRVDIALDSFPCTGLTVSAIAAWMGIPTVTLAGDSPTSRAGAALAHAIGLDSWIASDRDAYIEIAVAAARDLDALGLLRGSMREKMQRKLTDGRAFTRSYEKALRGAWAKWCENS